MNLEFPSSDEVGFWFEIEYTLGGGGKKAFQNEIAAQQVPPDVFGSEWCEASEGRIS